ncbi:MAG TPA: hypothetical protein VME42_20825 [Steroidobacteraceae bacterium]|nr:hypothetical protein [Steroidobacteraceae bacterium]
MHAAQPQLPAYSPPPRLKACPRLYPVVTLVDASLAGKSAICQEVFKAGFNKLTLDDLDVWGRFDLRTSVKPIQAPIAGCIQVWVSAER